MAKQLQCIINNAVMTNVFQKHFLYFSYFIFFFSSEFTGDLICSLWIPVQPLLNPSPGNTDARKAGGC